MLLKVHIQHARRQSSSPTPWNGMGGFPGCTGIGCQEQHSGLALLLNSAQAAPSLSQYVLQHGGTIAPRQLGFSSRFNARQTSASCISWVPTSVSSSLTCSNNGIFQFNILSGIAQPSLSIARFRLHSKICVSVKCLRPAAGAVQQSAVCSQSQGARGGTNSGNLFCTGSAMCCGSLCKWLH